MIDTMMTVFTTNIHKLSRKPCVHASLCHFAINYFNGSAGISLTVPWAVFRERTTIRATLQHCASLLPLMLTLAFSRTKDQQHMWYVCVWLLDTYPSFVLYLSSPHSLTFLIERNPFRHTRMLKLWKVKSTFMVQKWWPCMPRLLCHIDFHSLPHPDCPGHHEKTWRIDAGTIIRDRYNILTFCQPRYLDDQYYGLLISELANASKCSKARPWFSLPGLDVTSLRVNLTM